MTTHSTHHTSLWRGLRSKAQATLAQRDYTHHPVSQQIAAQGMEAGQVIACEQELRTTHAWIPGIEIFARKIYPQQHRGCFGELSRSNEGVLKQFGLVIQQWSAARMFAGTSKGFHIHPPYVPDNHSPAEWFQKLYKNSVDPMLRCYDKEQWDVMFFLQGRAEILLVDEREGMDRRVMRIWIEGDNYRGKNNAGVVIPPGVAHAIHAEGSEDLVMVYGTTTVFNPENEGRLAHEIELASLPPSWENYIKEAN